MSIVSLSFLISFSVYAVGSGNGKVASLKQLSTTAVIKSRKSPDNLPINLKGEVLEQQKKLDTDLLAATISGRTHPFEVKKFLNAGADANYPNNPNFRSLLEQVTEVGYLYSSENAQYSFANGTTRGRSAIVASYLIQSGAKFTSECLFNAVRCQNQELVEVLLNNYFPETEWKWCQTSTGYWRGYEERSDENLWKGLKNDYNQNLFHYAVLATPDPDFLKWFFFSHAKWKCLLEKDDNDCTVIDYLNEKSRQPGEAGEVCGEILQWLQRQQSNQLLPALWTECIVDSTKDIFERVGNTEVAGNVTYNFKRLLGQD